MSKILTTFVAVMLLIIACSEKAAIDYTATADCSKIDPASNTYNGDISSILNGSCGYAGCHDTKTKEADVILDTYAGAKSSFVNGEALCSINHDCEKMPQGAAKLSPATIELLTCWVKNGAPE